MVLADFTNATGDSGFDGLPRQVLAEQLANSPDLSLLSDTRVSDTLRLMGQPGNARLTPQVAAEVCERTASAAVVDGSITSVGTEYMLSLRARNCQSGDVLGEEQASAARKQDVLKVLSQMASRFRERTAASLPQVENGQTLSAEVTTSSLEAWRSYSAAMKAEQSKAQATEEIPLLTRAVEMDPRFAMAYAHLGRLYASLGESELGAQNIAKAYALRNGVSDAENYFITFNFQRQVTRNLELARQTLESWLQESPGSLNAHGFLAAFTTQGSGHYEKAAEEGLKAIELDPDYAIGYENVAFAYIYLNRLPDAEAILRRASERKIEVIEFSLCRYFIAFLRGDQAAMDREVTQRRAKLSILSN